LQPESAARAQPRRGADRELCPEAKVTAALQRRGGHGEARQVRHDATAVTRLTGLEIPIVAQHALLARLGFAVAVIDANESHRRRALVAAKGRRDPGRSGRGDRAPSRL